MVPALPGVATGIMQGPAGAVKRTVGIVFDKVMEYHMREGQSQPADSCVSTAQLADPSEPVQQCIHLYTVQAAVKQVPLQLSAEEKCMCVFATLDSLHDATLLDADHPEHPRRVWVLNESLAAAGLLDRCTTLTSKLVGRA